MIRIKELRNERELSQKDLALYFHVAQSTVSSWEKGVRDPDTDTVASLAAFFDVSTDYLLGKTDIRKPAGHPSIDDATLEDIKAYARFKREQYNKR